MKKHQYSDEFETFWIAYPWRTGKLAAMREYVRAREIATAEDILAGIQVYMDNKPEYATYCHPRTFLHQGRWMDEPMQVKPQMAKQTSKLLSAVASFRRLA